MKPMLLISFLFYKDLQVYQFENDPFIITTGRQNLLSTNDFHSATYSSPYPLFYESHTSFHRIGTYTIMYQRQNIFKFAFKWYLQRIDEVFKFTENHTTTIDQYKYLNTYLFCSIEIRTLMHMPPPVLSLCYHSDTYKNFSTCNQDLQPLFLTIKWWCTKIPILMNFYILKLHYLLKTKELGLTLLKKKNKDSHISLIPYIWYYLFNLLKIVINIIKLVLQTYAVQVEDTTREDTIETALQ